MKPDVLRQPLMATLLLFAVMGLLFAYRSAVSPYPEELFTGSATPLEAFLIYLTGKYQLFSLIVCILLVFANGLSVSRILSRHMVLSSRSYLPMIFYLVTSCGIWLGGAYLAAALSSFLLLRATEYFILSFVRKTSFNQTFRGSLLIGFIPLILPPAAVYLLAIPLGMAIFRRGARETTAALIASLLPLLTYAYVMWAFDYGFIEPLAAIWHGISSFSAGLPLGVEGPVEIMRIVTLAITAILLLFGLGSFLMMSDTMRTRSRAIFIYFILLLIIGGCQLLIPGRDVSALIMVAVPVSAIIPAFFSRFPGWVSGSAYLVYLLSVTALNAYPLLPA